MWYLFIYDLRETNHSRHIEDSDLSEIGHNREHKCLIT